MKSQCKGSRLELPFAIFYYYPRAQTDPTRRAIFDHQSPYFYANLHYCPLRSTLANQHYLPWGPKLGKDERNITLHTGNCNQSTRSRLPVANGIITRRRGLYWGFTLLANYVSIKYTPGGFPFVWTNRSLNLNNSSYL